jgi:hypothetical protein
VSRVLGMTKGNAALTSAAVTYGWTKWPQCAIFIPLAGLQANQTAPLQDDDTVGVLTKNTLNKLALSGASFSLTA